jgi:hypothetical protein
LYNNDGSECTDKLKILARTYPSAVAGDDIAKYIFVPPTAEFNMEYSLLSSADTVNAPLLSRTTEIRYNKAIFYPHGINVELTTSPAGSATVATPTPAPSSLAYVTCAADGTTVQIVQAASASTNTLFVRASPCLAASAASCSCP